MFHFSPKTENEILIKIIHPSECLIAYTGENVNDALRNINGAGNILLSMKIRIGKLRNFENSPECNFKDVLPVQTVK